MVEDQFTELFHAHAGRLVRLAALLGDQDPEDAAAEAFCKFYKARRRVTSDDRPVGYLNRILVNASSPTPTTIAFAWSPTAS